jgi:hypothetical protein
MRISRDSDGLRFFADCAPETGFVPDDIHCLRCGRRVQPHGQSEIAVLRCSACNFSGKVFWSEADLYVYLAEQWERLRQACSHPAVTTN